MYLSTFVGTEQSDGAKSVGWGGSHRVEPLRHDRAPIGPASGATSTRRGASHPAPRLLPPPGMDLLPGAVFAPHAKIMIHRLPWRQVAQRCFDLPATTTPTIRRVRSRRWAFSRRRWLSPGGMPCCWCRLAGADRGWLRGRAVGHLSMPSSHATMRSLPSSHPQKRAPPGASAKQGRRGPDRNRRIYCCVRRISASSTSCAVG